MNTYLNFISSGFLIFKFSTSTNRRVQQKFVPTPPIGASEKEIQLKKDLQRQNMLDRVFESEEKSAIKRAYRQQTLLDKERQMEEALITSENERIMKQQAREQEERLAAELERYKIEQLRDTKMRQQLRETR